MHTSAYVSIRHTTNMRASTGLEDLLARQPPRMPGVLLVYEALSY